MLVRLPGVGQRCFLTGAEPSVPILKKEACRTQAACLPARKVVEREN